MSGSARIRSLTRRGDATVLLSVEVSRADEHEAVEFILLDELFLSLDLKVGEIDEEMLYTLDRYSEVTAAYLSACMSFAYVQSSLGALYTKLVGKGFSKETSAEAIEIIRERGFVDEDAVAMRRAEIMVKKLWGRTRILRKLREEGFPDSAIEGVSEELYDVDFAEMCARVIEKKFSGVPEDRKEREKMFASLSRFGYSAGDIRSAVRLISDNI